MSRRRSVIRRSVTAAAIASALVATPLLAGVATASPAPRGVPATPGSVSLTSGKALLRVAWSESSSGSIVYTATAKAPGNTTEKCKTALLACTIASLVNGVVYDVTVVAATKAGSSAASIAVSATVGVPNPPLSVHATATTAAAIVTWAAPKASAVSRIVGYTATASPGGFSCSTTGTLVSNPARSCEIAGLSSGSTYSVTVTASNAFGNGSPSAPASVTPT